MSLFLLYGWWGQMMKIDDVLQRVLIEQITPVEGLKLTRKWITDQTDPFQKSKYLPAYRVCRVLNDIEEENNGSSWGDFAGHLRQIILNTRRKVTVSPRISKRLTNLCNRFQLTLDADNEVNALFRYPDWLPYLEQMKMLHTFPEHKNIKQVIGDGILYGMTGHSFYTSRAQKEAVRAAMTLPPGHTLLACLPTGGGKSLVGQLPAFFATEGGTLSGAVEQSGTTVVIVPTVALAIDQAIGARCFFPEAMDDEHSPVAYFNGMDDEKKQAVYKGIKNGTMPLVYISPEAILNGQLGRILLEAARNKKINTLVIDEAHIVVDWGSDFRPEFQYLSSFRRQLLKAGQGRLRTILLSATLTEWCSNILIDLFSEPNKLIKIRGDALRSEPIYWLDSSQTEEQRCEKIIELLPLLPRPIILYLTSPSKAKEWNDLIRESGLDSVGLFTGETNKNQREKILEKWRNNEVDIMVATSAFGMGVDKPDIRTIIHCCLPESLNRFYQEVGRGGRDGLASMSLLSVVGSVDYDETRHLVNGKVLKSETIALRWNVMREQPVGAIIGNEFWADTGCKPPHLQDQTTGKPNAGFNDTVLLFLYRNNLINIVDTEPASEEERRHVFVEMLDLENLTDETKLMQHIENTRESEREYVKHGFDMMQFLSRNHRKACWNHSFSEIYPYTVPVCGGCPYCFSKNYMPDDENEAKIFIEGISGSFSNLKGNLRELMGADRELYLYTSNTEMLLSAPLTGTIIKNLVYSGVQQLVLPIENPDWGTEIVGMLPANNCQPYNLFDVNEILLDRVNTLRGTIGIVFLSDSGVVNQLFQWARKYLQISPNNRVIYVAEKNYYIESEDKKLKDLVDGGRYEVGFIEIDNPSENIVL